MLPFTRRSSGTYQTQYRNSFLSSGPGKYQPWCSRTRIAAFLSRPSSGLLSKTAGASRKQILISCVKMPHNKALQLTANPRRGLSVAELSRYADFHSLTLMEPKLWLYATFANRKMVDIQMFAEETKYFPCTYHIDYLIKISGARIPCGQPVDFTPPSLAGRACGKPMDNLPVAHRFTHTNPPPAHTPPG